MHAGREHGESRRILLLLALLFSPLSLRVIRVGCKQQIMSELKDYIG